MDDGGDVIFLGADEEAAPVEEEVIDPMRLEFRQARREWYQDNQETRPQFADYMSAEEHDALMAFKNSYEGEGRWWKSDLLSDDMRDYRSTWQ